jgi:hypothetical protein
MKLMVRPNGHWDDYLNTKGYFSTFSIQSSSKSTSIEGQ